MKPKPEELRKVERRVGKFHWEQCRMKDLKKGDVFRLHDPGWGEHMQSLVALSDPHPRVNEEGVDTWAVEAVGIKPISANEEEVTPDGRKLSDIVRSNE